jgi:hypothetical protein
MSSFEAPGWYPIETFSRLESERLRPGEFAVGQLCSTFMVLDNSINHNLPVVCFMSTITDIQDRPDGLLLGIELDKIRQPGSTELRRVYTPDGYDSITRPGPLIIISGGKHMAATRSITVQAGLDWETGLPELGESRPLELIH